MDLNFTAEELAFREEARRFFRSDIPQSIRDKVAEGEGLTKDDMVTSQRILNARGWATVNWPVQWGGQSWSPVQIYMYQDEMQQANVPTPIGFNVTMVGPVIAQFGSDVQKQQFLPKTANADIFWCQGFSEPGSGSDLASLRTRAERKGDKYIINGQKIWTTLAQYADWIFCLVRTDPTAKKQEGISFILVDIKTPGITVRPIITIDGGREVNEVFFDNVEVPAENLVGQENKGWDYAKFLLGNERTGIARVGASKAKVARIKELASMERVGDRPLIDDPRFREKLAAVEIELKALEMTQLRVVADERKREKGKQNPASSLLKLKGSVIQQQLTELVMEVVGPYAMPYQRDFDGRNEPVIGPDYATEAAPMYFNYRKVSIYGGSNEIQRNIVAKAILGLERMDFDLTDEQRLLKDSVDRLIADQYQFEQRKKYLAQPDGWSREVWQQFAELGLLGLPFAEQFGGFGGGPVETMIVMEAFGRGLVLEPYFATVTLGGGLLRRAGTPAQQQALIPEIAQGKLKLAFAHVERQSRYDVADVATTARRDGDSWVLDGAKSVVLHGDCANRLLVTARVTGDRRDRDGIGLFLVDPSAAGVTRRGYPTQDGLRAAEITLSGVRVAPGDVLGEPGKALPVVKHVVDEAIAALCAEAVGTMQVMHETTLEYLKTRQQFGRPIGQFQVLQHRSVDMLVALEQARSMAMFAAVMAAEEDATERRRAMAAAKVQIGRSGKHIGQEAIQLHGGIGMTQEYKVGHYFKRMTMIDILFGDADTHLATLAKLGGLFGRTKAA